MGGPTKSTLIGLTKDERKRNSDRASQRALRERKKDRIQYLERTVDRLHNQDADGSVRELMEEVEQLKDEKESLKRLVDQVGVVTSSLQQWRVSAGGERGTLESGAATSASPETETGGFQTEVASRRSPLFVEIVRDYARLKARPDVVNMLRDTYNIVKATLNGWESIVKTEANPLQDTLGKYPYETRLRSEEQVNRPAECILFDALEDPNSEDSISVVPFWLHHTETQKAVQHSLIVGILPWPSMRDYRVRNPSFGILEAEFEVFTLEFLRCIRFVPQINFESSFTIDEFSGRLEISRAYRHLFFDSSPFAMASEFFMSFPEFKDMVCDILF
ncbi:hypothetical protein VTL71DRAFT_3326 [Oculimacula yallundae]|uniref:BZIP domain-containing protein n=1 Tax=Oculimacula yallundae TaxID=86028 RepID=A0ABR4C8P2_9HELO